MHTSIAELNLRNSKLVVNSIYEMGREFLFILKGSHMKK